MIICLLCENCRRGLLRPTARCGGDTKVEVDVRSERPEPVPAWRRPGVQAARSRRDRVVYGRVRLARQRRRVRGRRRHGGPALRPRGRVPTPQRLHNLLDRQAAPSLRHRPRRQEMRDPTPRVGAHGRRRRRRPGGTAGRGGRAAGGPGQDDVRRHRDQSPRTGRLDGQSCPSVHRLPQQVNVTHSGIP